MIKKATRFTLLSAILVVVLCTLTLGTLLAISGNAVDESIQETNLLTLEYTPEFIPSEDLNFTVITKPYTIDGAVISAQYATAIAEEAAYVAFGKTFTGRVSIEYTGYDEDEYTGVYKWSGTAETADGLFRYDIDALSGELIRCYVITSGDIDWSWFDECSEDEANAQREKIVLEEMEYARNKPSEIEPTSGLDGQSEESNTVDYRVRTFSDAPLAAKTVKWVKERTKTLFDGAKPIGSSVISDGEIEGIACDTAVLVSLDNDKIIIVRISADTDEIFCFFVADIV